MILVSIVNALMHWFFSAPESSYLVGVDNDYASIIRLSGNKKYLGASVHLLIG